MAVKRGDVYSVLCNATVLGAITRSSLPSDTQVRTSTASGALTPRRASTARQGPRAEFSTLHIASALNLIDSAKFRYLIAGAGLGLFAHRHEDGGTRLTGSAHRKYNLIKGIMVPRRLSVAENQDAELSLEAFAGYNGSVNPVVLSTAALPTDEDQLLGFTLSPSGTVAGVAVPNKVSIDIDFGITVEPQYADSQLWPEFYSIVGIEPVIRIRGIDDAWIDAAALILQGNECAHDDTVIYLRKRLAVGAGFVADGTAEHIAITAAGLVTPDNLYDAQHRKAGEVSVMITCRMDDDDNPPLLIDTAAAIS